MRAMGILFFLAGSAAWAASVHCDYYLDSEKGERFHYDIEINWPSSNNAFLAAEKIVVTSASMSKISVNNTYQSFVSANYFETTKLEMLISSGYVSLERKGREANIKDLRFEVWSSKTPRSNLGEFALGPKVNTDGKSNYQLKNRLHTQVSGLFAKEYYCGAIQE